MSTLRGASVRPVITRAHLEPTTRQTQTTCTQEADSTVELLLSRLLAQKAKVEGLRFRA